MSLCKCQDIVERGIPSAPQSSNDRIPTLDEILELLKYPDRRIKPIALTMISSGIRVGAWEWLKWKHIIPIYDKDMIASKLAERVAFLLYTGTQGRIMAYNKIKKLYNQRSRFVHLGETNRRAFQELRERVLNILQKHFWIRIVNNAIPDGLVKYSDNKTTSQTSRETSATKQDPHRYFPR
jgi:Apea-like HEPN